MQPTTSYDGRTPGEGRTSRWGGRGSSTTKAWRVAAALLAAALLFTACGGDDDDTDAASKTDGSMAAGSEAAGEPRPATYGQGANASEATRVVQVTTTDDFRFAPAEIAVKKGDIVTFRVVNAGKLPHEFTIGGPNAQRLHELQMASMDMSDGMDMDDPMMDHGSMDQGSMKGAKDGGSMDSMSKRVPHAGERAQMIAELEEKAAFSDSVHVMPGETKELTWAFTGRQAPLIGCHIPGHWDGGMRGELVWA